MCLVMVALHPCGAASAGEPVWPGEEWAAADADQMKHWSADKLAEAESYWKEQGSTAVMVIERGRVALSWGDVERPVPCHSVRKSFLSVLYGIYRDSAGIDLSQPLKDLGFDDGPSGLTDEEKQATIGLLLMSRSGIYHDAAYETRRMRERKPERGSHAPGTHWYYNNWDFNALGTIFTEYTGKTVFEAFEEAIAEPTGMQDFDRDEHTKFVYSSGSQHPAYTFQLSTRDRARFGLLCLMNGKWDDEQIVPEDWVEESTTAHSKPEGRQSGYGYMWWVGYAGRLYGNDFQKQVYSASGNHGQRITILPELEMVVVQSVDRPSGDAIQKGKSYNGLLRKILAARRGE